MCALRIARGLVIATALWGAVPAAAAQFPCSEQGIRDAIALGGGPHTFACAGPTTVVTAAEIVIDNDVILDGEGNLIVDGNDDHRVFDVHSVALAVTAELRGLTIQRGRTSDDGGGIVVVGESLTLVDVVVSANHADWSGGGISVEDGGSLTLQRCTLDGNHADGLDSGLPGGGLGISYADAVVIDSTISRNTFGPISGGIGGGISISDDGSVTVSNSTISGNTPPAGTEPGFGGGIAWYGYRGEPHVVIHNSTLAENFPNPVFGFYLGDITVRNSLIRGSCFLPQIQSSGGNVESPGDTCGLTDPSDRVNITAYSLGLRPLADNGGPTQTHALLPRSVAIDAAVGCPPPDADQRGVARPQYVACDSGAYELDTPLVPSLSPASLALLATLLAGIGAVLMRSDGWHTAESKGSRS